MPRCEIYLSGSGVSCKGVIYKPEFGKFYRECLDKRGFEEFMSAQKVRVCRGRIHATRSLRTPIYRSPYKDQRTSLHRTCEIQDYFSDFQCLMQNLLKPHLIPYLYPIALKPALICLQSIENGTKGSMRHGT